MEEVKHRVENVFGYSTVVASIGFDDELQVVDGTKNIIVLIPGNPGLIEFYQVFMKRLYELKSIPIIGFSHAGMDEFFLFVLINRYCDSQTTIANN